jgi:hypothetical protein
MDKAQVRRMSARWGWSEVQDNDATRVLGFIRAKQRINVYYVSGVRACC